MKTLEQICRGNTALQIQNACNPRGVARELVRQIDAVCSERNRTDISGDPGIALILDTLADMNGRLSYQDAAEQCFP